MTDNVANTRKGFAAFAAGDMDTIKELLDPEIVWHVPGRSSMAGDYRGIDATLGYFTQLFERSGGTVKSELRECGEIAPDLVACLVHLTGTTPTGSIDQHAMMLFRERSGRSIEVWNFSSDQYAQDQMWGPAAIAMPDVREDATPLPA